MNRRNFLKTAAATAALGAVAPEALIESEKCLTRYTMGLDVGVDKDFSTVTLYRCGTIIAQFDIPKHVRDHRNAMTLRFQHEAITPAANTPQGTPV